MDPTLALDHIVIAVNDLEAAIADYRAMGFQVLVGGQHPGRTSHNALIVFADGAYLEIIAWRAPAPEERWYRTLRDHGEGLVDFALLPHDTAQMLAEARARGLDTLTGPLAGGRVRPDGEQLRWQTARHATPDVPFLCGDITPRALRVPEGDVRTHPNGALGVAQITVAVHDLDTTLGRYRALLGSAGPSIPDANAALATVDGVRSATLTVGPLKLLLQSTSTAGNDGAAMLGQRLASRGEGPCAVTLRHTLGDASAPSASDDPGTPRAAFDSHLCHGVDLQWAVPPRS